MHIQSSKTSYGNRLPYIFAAVSIIGLLIVGLIALAASQAQKPSDTQAKLEFICNDMMQAFDPDNEIADEVIVLTCKDEAKTWAAAPDIQDCIGLYKSDEFLDLEFFTCLRERNIPFLEFTLESLKSK